ncbi:hypothetical protein SAMN06265795_1036 [Noviherbaspirillum humi]|uniref:Uncharacterized protein n=1 Tax=Noviherbaspirillum humi TaxID=1688639 RepID=A0A239EU91_9BURK|nr:hypothetical protein [Noviherbaspirillum humi]SNS47848.1 hypothetical protein SAMN06265795_1036 [Noviherbaspirillum humi]
MAQIESHSKPEFSQFCQLFMALSEDDRKAMARLVNSLAQRLPDEAFTLDKARELFRIAKRLQ